MTKINSFEAFLRDKVLEKTAGAPQKIADGIKYCLFDGGKRLRPSSLIAAAEMYSEADESVMYFAAAVECYHNFTLVHDDLPCMDDDDMRRGKPSCHKVYGEGQAVLIGDALLNLAYCFILESISLARDFRTALYAAQKFCYLSGAEGLIGGQSADIDAECQNTAENIDYIYKHKTGDLFCASIAAGAMLGGADDEQVAAMEKFAYCYGNLFQLTDDLLDENKNELHSALKCMDRDQAVKLAAEYARKAKAYLDKSGKTCDFFRELLEKTLKRQK